MGKTTNKDASEVQKRAVLMVLYRKNRKLRQANEMHRKSSACFAMAECARTPCRLLKR